MAEAIAAATSIVGIVGFSGQVFDGCIKGFVLLSSARNLGRDADILRSMLDWEQYRLEQWAEQVGLQDPAKADILTDWDLISKTLKLLDNLVNDTSMLKKKYNLILSEDPLDDIKIQADDDRETPSNNRFKRLFAEPNYKTSAAAKVVQAQQTSRKKLWWAAVDKENMKRLVSDISHFVQRLHDALNATVQAEMQQSIQKLLLRASDYYDNVPDLDYLRELAAQMRRAPGADAAGLEDLDHELLRKYKNLLFYSIKEGRLEDIEPLMDKGVNINARDRPGWTLFSAAAMHGQLEIMKLLLRRGADVSLASTIDKTGPLHLAVQNSQVEVVEYLLALPQINVNARDGSGNTPFFNAVDADNERMIQLLLQHPDTDINSKNDSSFTALLQCVFEGHAKAASYLLARPEIDVNFRHPDNDQTALWMSVSSNIDILKRLLARKEIDVDGRGRFGETPLCRAARQSYYEAAQAILGKDPDVNAIDERGKSPLIHAAASGNELGLALLLEQSQIAIDLADSQKNTALMSAAAAGHTKVVRALLAKDACVDLRDKQGRTALAAAAANGHKIAGKLLIKSKADVNCQDEKGNTPLALATEHKHDIVVRLLLENGAQNDIADEDEETPFEKARDQKMEDIINIFKEHNII